MSIFSPAKTFSRRSATALLAVGVLAGVAVGGGVGVIAASSTKTVTVCANNKTNILRYTKNDKCLKGETKVVLNQTGETGAAGVAGPAGPAGIGVKGDPGIGVKGDQAITGTNGVNATLAITQQAVCDGADADTIANEICKVGMTGPGGGLIFFVDYNDEYATYDYLEAASTNSRYQSNALIWPWARNTAKCGTTAPQTTNCQIESIYAGTQAERQVVRGAHRGLFGGKAATDAIIARHDSDSVPRLFYAAGNADSYEANGKSDWWLPSKDELQMMHDNLNNRGIGGFGAYDGEVYWSSSEAQVDTAWVLGFELQTLTWELKDSSFFVRPVRGF